LEWFLLSYDSSQVDLCLLDCLLEHRFRETSVYVPIIESAVIGSIYVLPTATDWDGPSYGVQRYELSRATNELEARFELQTSSKLDGSTEVG